MLVAVFRVLRGDTVCRKAFIWHTNRGHLDMFSPCTKMGNRQSFEHLFQCNFHSPTNNYETLTATWGAAMLPPFIMAAAACWVMSCNTKCQTQSDLVTPPCYGHHSQNLWNQKATNHAYQSCLSQMRRYNWNLYMMLTSDQTHKASFKHLQWECMQIIPMFKGAKTDNKIFKSDSQNLFQSFLDKPHVSTYPVSIYVGLKTIIGMSC